MYLSISALASVKELGLCLYEQSLKLFAVWLKDVEGVSQVEQIREGNIRRYQSPVIHNANQ